MAKRDYYEVLGVPKGAPADEIKTAFRKLAMKHHPDRNRGDKSSEEKFKEVKEAYDILSDEKKRAAYDRLGHAGVDPSSMGGGPGGMGGFNFEDFVGGIGDVFGDIFGNRGARGPTQEAGADLRYHLTISLEEAVSGVTKEIQVRHHVRCDSCNGSGAKKGTSPKSCPECGGSGVLRIQQGFFSVQQACPTCRGQGKLIGDPCGACRGQGRQQKTQTLSVKVPAGIDTGDQIRLSGEGDAGFHSGPAGDLYIQVEISEHPIFTRKGIDLHCQFPISFTLAALGGEIEAPTIDGFVKFKIPAETQTGKSFRFKGKGVKAIRGGHVGDLICQVTVETPVHLSREQKTLLEELQKSIELDKNKHCPLWHDWEKGVKRFFDGVKSRSGRKE